MSKHSYDTLSERLTRTLAGFSSRRSFIARLGVVLMAAPTLPLLPVSRASAAAPKTDFERNAQSTDPQACSYWKYCALGGTLCSCCGGGGGTHTCPAGAEPSPISWIGTCLNPDDSRSYIIAYRDCCGKTACNAGKSCDCEGGDRTLPTYRPQLNSDILWCFGKATATYHCSTAALVGVAS